MYWTQEVAQRMTAKIEDSFHLRVIRVIKKIPRGKVATYGQIAALAGNPRAARQVVRTLHSSSEKNKLPWHRVINGKGAISLPHGNGYELQMALLESEGVAFGMGERVNFDRYLWKGPLPAVKKGKARPSGKDGKKRRCAPPKKSIC